MSKSAQNHPLNRTRSPLEQWIYQMIARKGVGVQYRVRGNTLHLLCRKMPCPDRAEILQWLLPVLQKTDFSTLLPVGEPQLYQVWLYGCQPGDKRPRWTTPLYLNQLDRHVEQLSAATEPVLAATAHSSPQALQRPSSPSLPAPDASALALSNVALAKRGEEMAIACYLSETLNDLGVAVRVSAKSIPYTPPATVQADTLTLSLTAKRLWVSCEAAYSPDPSLLSQPITQKLRELEVEGFHDAIILFQVIGEAKPDWALRVDLTPPAEMLRDWARWGDIEAIQRLLNQDIATLQLQITTATLNATTLHLCCGSLLPQKSPSPVLENHKRAKADIALLLEAIAPQGIHAATLYGQLPQHESPLWVEWLDLPAAQHPAFAESALTLAKQGDWGAIAFLLHRLLNPDLDQYLATGGIRLQILPKQDLLHVMSEAACCPDRQQIAPAVIRFLRQLELANIAGIRLYGRRAGQKKPLWSYGVDFVSRSRLVPEVAPEFAATDVYVADLLPQPGQEVLRPDLTPEDLQQVWTRWRHNLLQGTQQLLLRSQLFSSVPTAVPEANVLPGQGNSSYGKKIALIWGAAGVLLLLQTNWLTGRLLELQANQPKATASVAIAAQTATPPVPLPSPQIHLKRAAQETTGVFNSSGFTRSGADNLGNFDHPAVQGQKNSKPTPLPYVPRSQAASLITAEILAEGSPLPSFNSPQLDEKLQLYYRFLEKFGTPDVLVVGSSRALRGVDPIVLQNSLNDLGYPNAKIFNFGINGATAQVVELLLQRILTPDQLPRLILWADGARAFNSGTVDVTYNSIVASEAYRQLLAGTLPIPHQTMEKPVVAASQVPINRSLTDSYQSIDRWLSQRLEVVAGRQADRDQLRHALQQSLTRFFPKAASADPLTPAMQAQSANTVIKSLQASQALPDESGFLSLSAQFNPATYYQKYARVLGAYDSDYEDFQITGGQDKALQALLEFTRTSQIPMVFVNLPLTEDYLDPVRLEYEQQFRDYMVQRTMSHPGFVFRDLSEQWTTQYSYFSDPSHLNRYGAYAVSVDLAQDAKIPWLRTKRTALQKPDHQGQI